MGSTVQGEFVTITCDNPICKDGAQSGTAATCTFNTESPQGWVYLYLMETPMVVQVYSSIKCVAEVLNSKLNP